MHANGVKYAYRELGTPGGVPVVFLHHFAAVLDDWDPRIIDGIAENHHVIAFDNRGVGATDTRYLQTSNRWARMRLRSFAPSAMAPST